MPPRDEERRYCREVLPRVSRTFAISIELLRGSFQEAVRIGYLLCRTADTIEDSWPGDAREIRARFDALVRAIEGDESAAAELAHRAAAAADGRPDLELVAHLPIVLGALGALAAADRDALADCVRTMCAGMGHFAARAAARPAACPYLDTEEELHQYCFAVAGCVGVMLTRLFAARVPAASDAEGAKRLALAPLVGEALQLTNIVLDWPVDLRRGRCFVPASWLADVGLVPGDLVGPGRPEVGALVTRLEALARGALTRVPEYLALIPLTAFRYRLFCLWPAVWAAASLDHARRDREFPWGATRPRLPRAQLWSRALVSVFVPPGAVLPRA